MGFSESGPFLKKSKLLQILAIGVLKGKVHRYYPRLREQKHPDSSFFQFL
jgi:hypothetical protein